MIQFVKCFLLFILLYSSDIIICLHYSNRIQNHLYMYQTNNSTNEENIYNMKTFSKLPIVENIRNITHSTNYFSYEHFIILEKPNEHFTIHNIKLMCQKKNHNQPNQFNLKILAVLLSTSYKQENISNIFQNICKNGFSCLFKIQLGKNKSLVDHNKIVHLKSIDNDLKRNKNNNNRHKITFYYICEDLNYYNQKQQSNEFKYVFNYEQLAFLKCENYLTVQVENLVGINYNKEVDNLNSEYISFYCSQRVICNMHMEDLYKDDNNNKLKNYIFYELTYRCVPPKVCSLCGNNSTCKLEKLYNKKKEITHFYNNLEYNESGIFDRLLLNKEQEEERNKTSFITNLEYNAIRYYFDDMITVGGNTYHILEICKCSKDYVQEGLSCVKKEKDKFYIRYANR
ncbi:putative protein, unknown function [Plasmodium gaboni]|uniref:Uncharacterized protein n=1 Tax=Plasmodium gaboni TaxID=647221 RepID=A0A151LX12_9APIC|nr:putative protein, unknown function [Plasmodium gaboni]KYO03718.1 putative protein, unknown function [Plasmodium gaboni]